ncbi:unnamed protein product, partial [Rotaria magnacalcarata]
TTATPQRSTENRDEDLHVMDDETEDNDDQVDNLNVSFASAVTENIEAPQDSNSVYYSVSSNNISKENKSSTSITKQELLARYFKKLNTGGYYCKLCSGTKNSNKVSFLRLL